MRRLALALGLLATMGHRPRAAVGGPDPDARTLLEQLRGCGLTADVDAYRDLPDAVVVRDLQRLGSRVRVAAAQRGAAAARSARYLLLNNRHDKQHYDADAVRAAEVSLVRELRRQLPSLLALSLEYPTDPAISRPDGDESLRFVLVPSGRLLDEALGEFCEGLRASPTPSVPHAGTLWFRPFSDPPLDRVQCPVPTAGVLGGPVSVPQLRSYVAPSLQGKVVSQGKLLDWAAGVIASGPGGLLGRCQTYARLGGAYFVHYELQGQAPLWTWAIPIADANGAARWNRSEPQQLSAKAHMTQTAIDQRFGSRYENRYGGIAWKTLERHNLSVLPVPRPVGSDELEAGGKIPRSERAKHLPQERITVAREVLSAHPILVLRRSVSWRPFMEDADWDDRLSFHGRDVGTALAVVVSADASDADLDSLVRAYYGLPPVAEESTGGPAGRK